MKLNHKLSIDDINIQQILMNTYEGFVAAESLSKTT